jgi:putative peptide zinc metalloprotease protein
VASQQQQLCVRPKRIAINTGLLRLDAHLVLCAHCHRQVGRAAPFCTYCGRSLNGAPGAFDLVLTDGTSVPLTDELTIGRSPGNSLQLDDASVSRHHAVIRPAPDRTHMPTLEDVGSRYGVWVDGQRVDAPLPLRDGSRIRLGNLVLHVERARSESEPGRTIVVPPGNSLVVPAVGATPELAATATDFGERPRLRSGYALKRLEAGEGPRRWVLHDLRGGRFFHFTDEEAALVQLLDSSRSLADLAAAAEQRFGDVGPARLARVLADLGGRGLLAGSDVPESATADTSLNRLLKPREVSWTGARSLFEQLYSRGGWLLFTRPALAVLSAIAVTGIFVFALLVARRYGTPFVVASKIGLGGLVFVLGRFAVVAFHETAHGLTMASFGRGVRRAGLKLVLVFPYAYVDTSEVWFEPRRRRIAVSAAGPISDLVLGGVFSLCSLAVAAGTIRDIFFQLAFAAYVGSLFNLNPMLERDGYHILVDYLQEPGLRRRAREYLARRLSGQGTGSSSRVLARYALLSIVWTAVAALFVATLSIRYEAPLAAAVPTPIAWLLLGALWAALLAPVIVMVGAPLRRRRLLRRPV